MPVASGRASGVPIGAGVAHGAAAEVFQPGNHGTTFGGNPLAMRAGLVTIAAMEEEGLLENAAAIGQTIMSGIERGLAGTPGFVEVRGQGLMIGIELAPPCGALGAAPPEAGRAPNAPAGRGVGPREPCPVCVGCVAPPGACLCWVGAWGKRRPGVGLPPWATSPRP